MSLSTINIPSLHNGVSQQSPTVRSSDQCEEQDNGWASLADGLLKRPPLEHIAQLLNVPIDNAYVHEINRDTTERYLVVAAEGVLRVFTMEGTEVPVVAPAGWGYLTGVGDYAAELSMTTVADYTFVVNRNASPRMRSMPEGTTPGEDPVFPPIVGEDAFVPPRGPGPLEQNDLVVLP